MSTTPPPSEPKSDPGASARTGRLAPPAFWQQERWRYAFLSFLLGVTYSVSALLLGLEFRFQGEDVSLQVGALIEVSFAIFGYLLGATVEARRGEKRAAEEARRRLIELGDLRARLAHTEKLAALGQLSSAVAHEVRNPLAILRSMAQNLGEELDEGAEPARDAEGARQVCSEMIEEIDRLARVTSRLVDFARPVVLRPSSMRLEELVARVRMLVEAGAKNGSKARLIATGPADCRLEGDADLLCQLLLGLVDNAVEASPEGGSVSLGWGPLERTESASEVADGGLEVWVSDEGAGVPAAEREKIFEPFFTTRPDGHGLGLAVARQIATAHGGRLRVEEARPGTDPPGARFVLLLPSDASGLAREAV